jgi:hypothetical protein
MRELFTTARELAGVVPPGETLVLADEARLVGTVPPGRRALPFLERDGQYWGPPADDATAVAELERMRTAGAGYLVVAWPAFWWLEHYREFRRHLTDRYRCILRNERLVAFDLGPGDPLASPDPRARQ